MDRSFMENHKVQRTMAEERHYTEDELIALKEQGQIGWVIDSR